MYTNSSFQDCKKKNKSGKITKFFSQNEKIPQPRWMQREALIVNFHNKIKLLQFKLAFKYFLLQN